MTTDGDTLLTAILANRDDDTPRLAYADWCEENGRLERGEFIRIQVQLAKWDCSFKQTKEQPGWFHGCDTDEHGYWLCQPLRFRAQELFDKPRNFINWLPSSLHTGSGVGVRSRIDATVYITGHGFKSAEFSRGFVSALTCSASDWQTHAAAILSQHPIERVGLTTWPDAPRLNDEVEYATAAHDIFGPALGPIIRERRVWHYLGRRWPDIKFELLCLDREPVA